MPVNPAPVATGKNKKPVVRIEVVREGVRCIVNEEDLKESDFDSIVWTTILSEEKGEK